MNSIIQERLNELAAAVDDVLESTTTYNPSISAATRLVAADDLLSSSLDDLAQHQANQQYIGELEAQLRILEAQVRAHLRTLSEINNSLHRETPVTVHTDPDNTDDSAPADLEEWESDFGGGGPVAVDELLLYAQRIAAHTQRPHPPPPTAPIINNNDEPAPQTNKLIFAPPTTSSSSPAASPPPAEFTNPFQPEAQKSEMQKSETQKSETQKSETQKLETQKPREPGLAVLSLDPGTKAWVEEPAYVAANAFVPWPAEDVLQRGALAKIQSARERGVDPATTNLADEQDGGAKEQQKQEELEAEEQRQLEQERKRRGSVAVGRAPLRVKPEAKQEDEIDFGFDLYDPNAE